MADLPEGFDLEALLAPIPGDAPQGIDIREDFSAASPYNRLRDARSEARDAERGQDAGDADVRDPTPHWRSVRELALTTLAATTKDLEVAAWLTEALVRSHGLAGLAAGAQLMQGLAEQYWDGLFPLPDDYGMETRVAPVTGLNGRDGNGSLIQPLYKLVLFNRPDGAPVAYYQYRQSEQLGTLEGERRQQRIDAGVVPLEALERDARAAGGGLFAALLSDARAARDAWQAMADRAGREGRRRWPFHHGGPRSAVRHHRCGRALRAGRHRRWRRRRGAGGRRRGYRHGGRRGRSPASRRRRDRLPRARTRCARSPRSPASFVAPNRTRRSPTRSTRRCAVDA